jgi:hypothetical protein
LLGGSFLPLKIELGVKDNLGIADNCLWLNFLEKIMSTISGIGATTGLLASVVKSAETREAIDVAVLKKGQDVQKANGEAALNLIESATSQKIDVHV